MTPALRKIAAMLLIPFVVIPCALAGYSIFVPYRVPAINFSPDGLYSAGDERTSHYTSGPSSTLKFRYHVGMRREEIQKNFTSSARRTTSDSRPDCDVYDDGESCHALFFDDAEFLIRAQQFPSFICRRAVSRDVSRSGAVSGCNHRRAFAP